VILLEREISSTVSLTVSLVSVAALLSIIFYLVAIGGNIEAGASETLSDISTDLSGGYIEDLYLGSVDREMPAATAYNILRIYERVIIESACYTGSVTHLLTEGPCIGDNLRGRVQLELFKVDGGYIAFVHKDTFTWSRVDELAKPVAEQENYVGYEYLRSKYNLSFPWKWW